VFGVWNVGDYWWIFGLFCSVSSVGMLLGC